MSDTTRITFACPKKIHQLLTARAKGEGIPRSQLIVEILESALESDQSEIRPAKENRLVFDMQERLRELETWRREMLNWQARSESNADNLETTIAQMLNDQLDIPEGPQQTSAKKGSIPAPKRK